LNLGEVSPALADKVMKKTGLNIAHMRHTIDTVQLRHAFDHHGPGKEKFRKQVPISFEAMSAYRDAVENYDDIMGFRHLASGTTILFNKRINGTLFVVEQLRTDDGDFAFYTMWIEKNLGGK
jgi:hypothetical protein